MRKIKQITSLSMLMIFSGICVAQDTQEKDSPMNESEKMIENATESSDSTTTTKTKNSLKDQSMKEENVGSELNIEKIKSSLEEHFPEQATISGIEESPFDNVYYFRVDGQAMMFVGEPRYIISGKLFDMKNEENMLNDYMASYYKEKLKVFNSEDYISFKPSDRDVKAEVMVFTDPSCPYCTKMHEKIDQYTGYGIQVNYLPFPRGGKSGPGYQKLLKTWCADSEQQPEVLTAAKIGDNQQLLNEQKVTSECRNKLSDIVDRSRSLAITGTPSIFLSTGHQVGGYLKPDVLLQKINELTDNGEKEE